jgi:hypothetical protein
MVQLEDIGAMPRVALLLAWQDAFCAPAPKGLSQSMMRRFLAFEIQSQAKRGLSRQSQRALAKPRGKANKRQSSTLKPGGRLLREWNGVTHVVDVTATGFAWQGRDWRSLSAIAKEITGAHWSGPRFFGLTKVAP